MPEGVAGSRLEHGGILASSFSRGARFWATLASGAVALTVLTWDVSRPVPWLAFLLLTFGAILSEQIIPVEPCERTPRISGPFLFAAVLLLPLPPLAFVVVAVQLATWLRRQWHWRVVVLDASARLVATAGAAIAYGFFGGAGQPGADFLALAGTVGAALTLTTIQHTLVPQDGSAEFQDGAWLAHLQAILTRLVVLLLGLPIAVIWQVNPWLTIGVVGPLVLTHRALIVPALRREARTDNKTGLQNIRAFNEALERELQRASRFGHPLSILMIDLDMLRQVNNTQGHQAGDAVLRGVAAAVHRNIREYDVAARFGGDELIVLLVECDSDDALGIAERIRRTVEETPFEPSTVRATVRATVSIGVASFPQHGAKAEEIIYQADMAVYRAKLGGRNRVCLAPPGHGGAGQCARDVLESPLPNRDRTDPVDLGPRGNGAHKETDQGSAGSASRPRILLNALMASAICAAAATIALAIQDLQGVDFLGMAGLVLFALAAEIWLLDLYDGSSMSLGVTPAIAAGMLFGLPGAALVGLTQGIVRGCLKRSQIRRMAFNSAVFVLGASVSSLIFRAFGPTFRPDGLPLLIGPALFAAVVYYAVNTGLVAVAMGLSSDQSPSFLWNERFRWLLVHYIVLGLLGLFLAAAYSAFGLFGLLAFIAPAFSVRYAMHQYISNTTEHVAELRRLNAEMQRSNREMAHINEDLLHTLAAAIDVRDPFVFGHSNKVAEYAVAVAREMDLSSEMIELIRQAALLHDIGKLGIAEAILNKPTRLDPDEYEQIKAHSTLGAALLGKMRRLQHLIPAIKHHHEWYNGRGYPDGLKGDEIPIEARILAVCDAIEAMASDRPYHRAMPVPQIVAELQRCSGTQFDPTVVQAFVRVVTLGASALVSNSAQAIRERDGRLGIPGLAPPNGTHKAGEVLHPV